MLLITTRLEPVTTSRINPLSPCLNTCIVRLLCVLFVFSFKNLFAFRIKSFGFQAASMLINMRTVSNETDKRHDVQFSLTTAKMTATLTFLQATLLLFYVNPSTRYLLLKFVDFVDGVTHKKNKN